MVCPILGHKMHSTEDAYYTSDYDLSKLTSHTLGMGIRLVPKNGVMNIPVFKVSEIRYAHYEKKGRQISSPISLLCAEL